MTSACDVCPYCDRIPGLGVDRPAGGVSGFDAPLYVGLHSVIVPTVGLLVPGYVLAVSRAHVGSMSILRRDQGINIWGELEDVLDRLEAVWGPYIAVESTTGYEGLSAGGCLAHAHIHLIPATPSLMTALTDQLGGDAEPFEPASLGGDAYFAFKLPGQTPRVVRDRRFPSQWIRRMLAADLGAADQYDWAVVAGRENLGETIRASLDSFAPLQNDHQAAVKAILVDGDRVLLAHYRRSGQKDLYALPGGRIEPGESAAECFRREVLEETGVRAVIGDFVASWNWWKGATLFVAHAFDGTVTDPTLSTSAQPVGESLARAYWAPSASLERLNLRSEHRALLHAYFARKDVTYRAW